MKNEKNQSKPLVAMGKGLVISYSLTFGILLLLSVLVTYTSLTEASVSTVAMGTALVAVFICGFKTARSAGSKGWLWGILSGVAYILIMIAIGCLNIEGYNIGTRIVVMLAVAVAGGGIGGILGVNKM